MHPPRRRARSRHGAWIGGNDIAGIVRVDPSWDTEPLMSVEMESSVLPERTAERTTAEIARTTRVDPRLPEAVPGFDAPFFQAGLAGYSDGARRLMARRHGCPYCITEALLDQTLINGGKGRVREDPDLLASECGLGDPGANRLAGLDDHPIAGQVMGTDPEEMAIASSMLVEAMK